jgi:hypothetical protein
MDGHVALHSSVRMDESMKVLKENLARHPDDRDTLLALLTFNRDSEMSAPLSNMPSSSLALSRTTMIWLAPPMIFAHV